MTTLVLENPVTHPALTTPLHLVSKTSFVDHLVEVTASIINTIWSSHTPLETHSSKLLPLSKFVSEILKRSKTSFSTLQLSLLYLVRLRSHVLKELKTNNTVSHGSLSTNKETQSLLCGRRMFLSALIVAAKYLQDTNYSNVAWSKISGLSITEINRNEMMFLKHIQFNLFVSSKCFKHWNACLLSKIQSEKRPLSLPLANACFGPTASPLVEPSSSFAPRLDRKDTVSSSHSIPSPTQSNSELEEDVEQETHGCTLSEWPMTKKQRLVADYPSPTF